MKHTLNTYEIVNALLSDDNARWTRLGAFKLAEILEEYEESTGEEIELDLVAIRCDWNESTAEELLSDYGQEGETPEELIERMQDQTEFYIVEDNNPPTYLYIAF